MSQLRYKGHKIRIPTFDQDTLCRHMQDTVGMICTLIVGEKRVGRLGGTVTAFGGNDRHERVDGFVVCWVFRRFDCNR